MRVTDLNEFKRRAVKGRHYYVLLTTEGQPDPRTVRGDFARLPVVRGTNVWIFSGIIDAWVFADEAGLEPDSVCNITGDEPWYPR